jgi:GMP synthase-like glutamine amidotransferase
MFELAASLTFASEHNSFDNDPWILKLVEFTKKVLDQDRVRIIGVCYGHQIIGRALGMKVGRGDNGWETSVCSVKLSKKGEELFKKDTLVNISSSIAYRTANVLQSIHQMHRDIVYGFPEGVTSLGSSPVCENQGMYSKGRLITIQGHPEFTEGIMRDVLQVRKDQGLWPIEYWRIGMDKAADHHDGVAIGAAFLSFLLDD